MACARTSCALQLPVTTHCGGIFQTLSNCGPCSATYLPHACCEPCARHAAPTTRDPDGSHSARGAQHGTPHTKEEDGHAARAASNGRKQHCRQHAKESHRAQRPYKLACMHCCKLPSRREQEHGSGARMLFMHATAVLGRAQQLAH